ncbi:MAG: hypothetical protein ACREPF_00320 [Rhodanobacteraceae bacterium]
MTTQPRRAVAAATTLAHRAPRQVTALPNSAPWPYRWDQDIPELEVLLDEAAHAEEVLDERRAFAA